MGRTNAPVTATAVLVAMFAAWHFTGGMHGTIVHIRTPPAASVVTATLLTTTQCEPLPSTAAPTPSPTPVASSSLATSPATPTPTPTPTPTASVSQLCIGVQAAQDSVGRGKTATWTIQLRTENGPATSVSVALTSTPTELPPTFTDSCPSGGGSATCTVGDMGTAVTPSSYQLQVQVAVPATTAGTSLTLAASADTSPTMTVVPAAGQSVTITGAIPKTSTKPAPSVVPTIPVQPTVAPATQPVIQPVTSDTTPAVNGGIPAATPVITTISPGNVGAAIPVVATAAAPAATVATSPAANIAAAGASPSTSPAQTGDAFSISVGMSAQTAQTLGWILLALVVTLVASKLISGYVSRARRPRQKEPATAAGERSARTRRARLPHPRLPRLRLPHPRLLRLQRHARPTRAERRATREQNWRRYLQSQQRPGADADNGLPVREPRSGAGWSSGRDRGIEFPMIVCSRSPGRGCDCTQSSARVSSCPGRCARTPLGAAKADQPVPESAPFRIQPP
jgi:hypothetical protein